MTRGTGSGRGAAAAPDGAARGRDGGSVTAETALLLPGVVVLLTAVLAAGGAVVAQVRCADAARAGARAAARGEGPGDVHALALRLAPAGAQVVVSARTGPQGREVHVLVTASTGLPLPGRPSLEVSGRASALAEAEAEADGDARTAP